MANPIAKIGDRISWTFDKTEHAAFRGKTFEAEVLLVDTKQQHYGVYADYGQDFIPFDQGTILKNKKK